MTTQDKLLVKAKAKGIWAHNSNVADGMSVMGYYVCNVDGDHIVYDKTEGYPVFVDPETVEFVNIKNDQKQKIYL